MTDLPSVIVPLVKLELPKLELAELPQERAGNNSKSSKLEPPWPKERDTRGEHLDNRLY